MQRESISIENCLANHSFQNWLVSNYVMYRFNVSVEELIFKERSIGGSKTAERIVQLLWANNGFIVSTPTIASQIYGIAGQSEINAITAWADQIRKRKLSNAEILFNARGVGWAVGVSKLGISEKSLLVMYRLWQDILQPVEENDIAQTVYGFDDESAIASVRKQTEKLRFRELPQTTARIEMKNNPEGRKYLLTHKTRQRQEQALSKNLIPQHLSFEFQDWLSSGQVSIIKIDQNEYKDISFPLDYNLKSHLLLHTLLKHRHYILSYSHLSYVLYGNVYQTSKVREQLSYLTDNNLLNLQRVIVLGNAGIGVDIRDIYASDKQLKFLHLLWTRDHSLEEIALILYQQYDSATKKRVFSMVSRTRAILNSNGLDIVLVTEGKKKIYSLKSLAAR